MAATVALSFLPSLQAQTDRGGRLYTGRSPIRRGRKKPVTPQPWAPASKAAAKAELQTSIGIGSFAPEPASGGCRWEMSSQRSCVFQSRSAQATWWCNCRLANTSQIRSEPTATVGRQQIFLEARPARCSGSPMSPRSPSRRRRKGQPASRQWLSETRFLLLPRKPHSTHPIEPRDGNRVREGLYNLRSESGTA